MLTPQPALARPLAADRILPVGRSVASWLRLLLGLLLFAALVGGSTGCSLFNKRKDTAKNETKPPGPGGSTLPKNDDPLLPVAKGNEYGGLLAGQIVDQYGGRPTNAYIRWTCLEESTSGGKGESEAPIDVRASSEGYFTIQGLKANKRYMLVARAQFGEKMLAGKAYATAPDARIVIKLDDRFPPEQIPPIPSPTPFPGNRPPKSGEKKDTSAQGSAWDPGITPLVVPQPPPDRGFGLDRPQPASPRPNPSFPQNIARDSPKRDDPLIRMPGPPGKPSDLPPPPAPPPSSVPLKPVEATGPQPPLVLPTLVGKRVINFSLPDVSTGRTWEWKKNRIGKVVLLDFWYTTCLPCHDFIPHLKIMQDRYGSRGLEVVSIACEQSGTLEEQKKRVARVATLRQTNYRLLLDPGGNPSMRTEFRINIYPTAILLDEDGNILWRHDGTLQRPDLDVLERQIRNRLGLQ